MPGGNPADNVAIRTIRADEFEALRELRLEALRLCPVAFSSDLAVNEARPMEWWRDLARKGTGDGEQATFVASVGDRLVGMTAVWGTAEPKQAHRVTIGGVYVRPHARSRGIAGRLLRAGLEWAEGKGKLIADLAVIVGNDTALRCYERAGFTVYGRQPMVVRVDGVFYDEWLMAKRLQQ